MNGNAPPSFPIQISFEPGALLLVQSEDYEPRPRVVGRTPALRVALAQEFDELAVPGPLLADDDRLRHAPVRFRAAGLEALGANYDSDVVRAEEVVGDLAHVGRPRRGKHTHEFIGQTAGRSNRTNCVNEAHVEHAVGFIKTQESNLGEVHRAIIYEVLEAARRGY